MAQSPAGQPAGPTPPPASQQSPARGLAAFGVRVAYGHRAVLDDVSLTCAPGEIVGLLGPNGAGKSTLLKAIVGLIPRQSGTVLLDGAPVEGPANRARVAYVPQRNDVDWDFPISVEDVVLLGRQGRLGLFGRPGAADREVARTALERLGMLPHRRTQIGELSGGQQQRVFLARALAQQGDVLLLDEPLTGVDTTTEAEVLRLLRDLRSEGQAIVLCTHDLPQAAELCDRLCLLNRRVVAVGRPADVLRPEVLVATYGGGLLPAPNSPLPEGIGLPLPHDAGDPHAGEEPAAVKRRGHPDH